MQLKGSVDAMVLIPNDRLLSVIEKGTTFKDAFAVCDEVVRQAVQGISDLITMPGIVNVDFADVRAIMQDAGSALMGIGKGTGETRAIDAAKQAINSPLLDVAIDGARGVLFSIHGGPDMSMWEVQEAARVITESIDKDAKVIFGAVEDARLKKGEIKVTVIASGFPSDMMRFNVFSGGTDNKSTKNPIRLLQLTARLRRRVEQVRGSLRILQWQYPLSPWERKRSLNRKKAMNGMFPRFFGEKDNLTFLEFRSRVRLSLLDGRSGYTGEESPGTRQFCSPKAIVKLSVPTTRSGQPRCKVGVLNFTATLRVGKISRRW